MRKRKEGLSIFNFFYFTSRSDTNTYLHMLKCNTKKTTYKYMLISINKSKDLYNYTVNTLLSARNKYPRKSREATLKDFRISLFSDSFKLNGIKTQN